MVISYFDFYKLVIIKVRGRWSKFLSTLIFTQLRIKIGKNQSELRRTLDSMLENFVCRGNLALPLSSKRVPVTRRAAASARLQTLNSL